MKASQIQRLRQAAPGRTDRGPSLPRPDEGTEGSSFGDTLEAAIDQVDGAQDEANRQVEAFVAGEQENLHEVTISMNQAELYFQLMTEVRNKALEGYQQLMRTQV